MEKVLKKYDLIIGLEIHAQLNTESKLFASDKNNFGDKPNSNVSPLTLAHPGTLPKLNQKAIEKAIKMGLACNCEIARYTTFDRKNYFYPDLPKGYQTTQDQFPICVGGYLMVRSGSGTKKINLNRIHVEEDAGKSSHDSEHSGSLLDYNRAGTPLIEIVTEPEINSAEEAGNLLLEIRKVIRYINVGDGNMEQGSLRCDANISLKPTGANELGKRVEIKNMNSIRNVQRAIAYEVKRQSTLLDAGEVIHQETRGFNDETGETTGQRSKEEANDYRYFPCPDLLPISISEEWINKLKLSLPKLPHQVLTELQEKYGLSQYDSEIIAESKSIADYFYATSELTKNYKGIANWIIGPIKNLLNEGGVTVSELNLSVETLAELIDLVDRNKLSFSIASTRVLPALANSSNNSALQVAEEMQLIQDNDESELQKTIDEVLLNLSDKVKAYKNGKKGLLGMFVGEVMKKSKGKANPKIANKLLIESLEK